MDDVDGVAPGVAAKIRIGKIMKQDRRGTRHLAAGQRDKPHEASMLEGIKVFEQQELAARRAPVYCGQLVSAGRRQAALAVTAQGAVAATHANRLFKGKVGRQSYSPVFFICSAVGLSVPEDIPEWPGPLTACTKWDFCLLRRDSLGGRNPPELLREGNATDV
ncbi:hypothetical protein P3T43_006957 [Paraburkholderia sp. GAS41]|uniref:hypothetical protein n=1 Tax=Paraburkholderia sp. GAS41 TaxID=3035134 RepID=UPI003D262FC7